MANIRGGRVKSIRSLKAGLKKGGSGYLDRIPPDQGVTVRFLAEPDEWVEFFEHYDDTRKFYPCTDDCPGCNDGDKPSKRYLVPAVDRTENKVLRLVLPKTAASSVVKKYDRYNTLLDRDYVLTREGTGFDTEYDVNPEPPSKFSAAKYDIPDLMEVLESQLGGDDEDEETPARGKATRSTTRKPARRSTIDDEEDEEDSTPRRGGSARPATTKVIRKAPGAKGVIAKSTTSKAPVKKTVRLRRG